MSDTPRTDALKLHPNDLQHTSFEGCDSLVIAPEDYAVLYEHVIQLERELQEANGKLAKLSRVLDFAEKANDAQSENEVACSASFAEALAYQTLELAEQRCDHWKQRAEELEKYNKAIVNLDLLRRAEQDAHDFKQLRDALDCAGSDLPQLLEAIYKLKADTKRLDWLESTDSRVCMLIDHQPCDPSRQAIDAAMKGEQT